MESSSCREVEQHGVLAHRVEDRRRLSVDQHLVLEHGVETEEHFLAVDDEELEQRARLVYADLHRGRAHEL